MVDRLLALGGTYWGWCSGRYDALWLAEELRRRGQPVALQMSGSSITCLSSGGLTIRDAYHLIPLGLDVACGLVPRPPVGPLGWPCWCREDCGGYCSITPALRPDRKAELAAYCVEDCKAAFQVLDALNGHAERYGYHLRGTLGGSAWATAQRWLDLPKADWRSSTWYRVRDAYYGGRVFCGKTRAPEVHQWDLSSAYPAALARTPLPVGEPCEVGRKHAGARYRDGTPGVYRATVRVPDAAIPPLPWRHDDRIWYPTGEITGVWTALELAEGEARGVEILSVSGGVTYPDGERVIFESAISSWFDVRAAHGKSSAVGQWQRLFANSLSGKLAESPERERIAIAPPFVLFCNPSDPECAATGCSHVRCSGRCGAYRQIDREGIVWGIPFFRQGPASHVHWAAYLTAANRRAWLAGCDAVGHEHVAYGATDSLWSTVATPPGETGDALGTWSDKGSFTGWKLRAPNVYTAVSVDTGRATVKAAGASDVEWEQGEGTSTRGVMGLREAAQRTGKLFARNYRHYRLPDVPLERIADRLILPDGSTTSVGRAEIEKRAGSRGGRAKAARESGPRPSVVDPNKGKKGGARLRRGKQISLGI